MLTRVCCVVVSKYVSVRWIGVFVLARVHADGVEDTQSRGRATARRAGSGNDSQVPRTQSPKSESPETDLAVALDIHHKSRDSESPDGRGADWAKGTGLLVLGRAASPFHFPNHESGKIHEQERKSPNASALRRGPTLTTRISFLCKGWFSSAICRV